MKSNTLILKKINISLVTLAFYVHLTCSAHSMNLTNAVGQALYSNPEIKAAESESRAVEYQICQEKSGYYPKVDVEDGVGWEYLKDDYKENALNSPVKGKVDGGRHQPLITLVQPLFSGFDTVNRVEKREKEHVQSVKKADETATLAAFKAAEAYVSVRRFQRLERTTSENVQRHQDIMNKVSRLVAGGKATAADIHTAKARLADSKTAQMDVWGDLSTAIANFIAETNIHPDHLDNAKINNAAIPTTLEKALHLSLENNRSVMLARSSVDVTKADVKVAQSPFYPTLNLEADARHSYNTGGKKGWENNAKALLVARWNLMRGGSDLYRYKEYNERMVKAQDLLRNNLRTAEREVRISWGERTAAALQAESLRKAVKEKEHVVSTYMKQFEIGKVSLLDLLDVVNEWFLAKGALITADATQDLTEARLLASCGLLISGLDLPQSGVPYEKRAEGRHTPSDRTEDLVQNIIKGTIKFTRSAPVTN